jgi:3-isopropylmalate/(R)-2-methylmalate dehydratase small subunit
LYSATTWIRTRFTPASYLALATTKEISRHAMEGADPEFVKNCRPGDIVVAGTNFGCGSSREHAAITLKASGVGAILAESFARIFFRNGINLGLPL